MADQGTFSFQVQQAAQTPSLANSPAAQGSVTGSTGPSNVSVAPGGDFRADTRTIDSLFKFGESLLRPHIEAARQKMAMDGMVAALQGMSAEQIQDDEITGGIFGDTPTVAAARQIEKIDAVNKLSLTLAEQAGETVAMDPNEFRAWLPQQMQGLMTGDTNTDTLITQAFTEQLPVLVDSQVKAHANFRQERARKAWSGNANTYAAKAAQAVKAAQAKQLSPELADKVTSDYLETVMGPAGISNAEYPKWLKEHAERQLAEGNMVAYNILRDTGALNKVLTDAEVPAFQKKVREAESRHALTTARGIKGASFGAALEVSLQEGISAFNNVEDLQDHVSRLNAEHLSNTGKELYDNEDRKRLAKYFFDGQYKVQKRMQDAGAGESYDQGVMRARALIVAGATNSDKDPLSKAQWQDAQNAEWEYGLKNDPDTLFRYVALDTQKWNVAENAVTPLKAYAINGEIVGSPERLQQATQVAQKLLEAGGPAALSRYMGADYAKDALELLDRGAAGWSVEQFQDQAARQKRNIIRRSGDHGIKEKDVIEYLGDQVGWTKTFGGMLTSVGMTEEGQSMLGALVARRAGELRVTSGISVEKAPQLAWGELQDRISFVGGYPMVTAPLGGFVDSVQESLAGKAGKQVVSPYSEDYNKALNAVIRDKMADLLPETLSGNQVGLFGGERFRVIGAVDLGGSISITTHDGETERPVRVSAEEVARYINAQRDMVRENIVKQANRSSPHGSIGTGGLELGKVKGIKAQSRRPSGGDSGVLGADIGKLIK